MKISEAEVRYVADLAHLKLTEDEIRRFCVELGEVLAYMDKLNELDTSEVEPMAQVLYSADQSAVLRDDCERPGLGNQAALANAPASGAGYFKVPKVIER